MLISTNILKNDHSSFNYIVTNNTQSIYTQVTDALFKKVSCFNLIGSYGTGKSSFLVAMESTFIGKTQYFLGTKIPKRPHFIKVIGDPKQSLRTLLSKTLNVEDSVEAVTDSITALTQTKDAVFIIIDEFGKCLEYALLNNPKEETYFFQQIAETVNDLGSCVLITTQHQNFDAYTAGASESDAVEWEKVSGRFTPINFNEPPETLIKLAVPTLKKFGNKEKVTRVLNKILSDTRLLPVGYSSALKEKEVKVNPLDGITSYVVISLLQKYGQNERSLFSFLNAKGSHSISAKEKGEPYLLSDFFNYAIDRLSHVIYSSGNPDKLQWESAERAIQRADHHSSIDPRISHPILKSILLINVFGREGLFDLATAKDYFSKAYGIEAENTLDELTDKNIIQFLRHKGKLTFVEGTDINIQGELSEANRKIPALLDLRSEFNRLMSITPALAKKHYLTTGTPRFAEFHLTSDGYKNRISDLDGNTHVYVSVGKTSAIKAEIICQLKGANTLDSLVRDVIKYEIILTKYAEDFVVKKIIARELSYSLEKLQKAFTRKVFEESIWKFEGKKTTIGSQRDFNSKLSKFFGQKFKSAPSVNNELINKSVLSASINTARRALLRKLLERYQDPTLGYDQKKFPADKTIIHSTLIKEGMLDIDSGVIKSPSISSSYYQAWKAGLDFLEDSRNGKKSVHELIEILKRKPYGLKDGLVKIWLMFFLVAEEENYALYYSPENKFLPYFSDDIYEAILKKPENFVVKRYNYDRLSDELIAEYKRSSLYLEQGDTASARTAYFRIYGELLSKLKNLETFTKTTNSRLSKEAIGFRDALTKANDPEEALLSLIPNAIGFNDVLSMSPEQTAAYFEKMRKIEGELGECFDVLIKEFYEIIAISLGYSRDIEMKSLKDSFKSSTAGVDTNQLSKESRVLFMRMGSPLDIQNAWTKSVVDAIIGKNLESIKDNELGLAFKQVKSKIDDLLEACQLFSSGDSQNQFVLKLTLPDGTTFRRILNKTDIETRKMSSSDIEILANQLLKSLSHE
jgi:hypothetical protein